MHRLLLLALSALLTFPPTSYAAELPATKPAEVTVALTVYMVGDSTMASYPVKPAKPLRGWGQMLSTYFQPVVLIDNRAISGYTSKACLDKVWPGVIKAIKPGDYVIIQFGHNDMKEGRPGYAPANGLFKDNLARMVKETREHNAIPILVTPVARRSFDKDNKVVDTHGDYPKAVRQLAAEQMVPILDLTQRSMDLLQQLGPERSKILFSNPEKGEYPDYKPANAQAPGEANPQVDNTHFNAIGACRMCDLAAEELRAKVPELAKWLRP